MLEFSIKPFMVMFDLLTKSWLWQQLLMTWCVPNNHQWSFTQTPTIQCLLPCVVTQSQRRELKFDSPSLAHRHSYRRPQATPDLTLLPSHRVMVTWLVKPLYSEKKVIIPQKESVWQWSVDYHKFHTIRQSRFHADGSHHDFGENTKQVTCKCHKETT